MFLPLTDMLTSPTIIPRVYVLGFVPTEAAKKCIVRWRDKGYSDKCVWKGFEMAVARFIERSYCIPCTATATTVPELLRQMEGLLPEMLPAINISGLLDCDMSNAYLRVRCIQWKFMLEIVRAKT